MLILTISFASADSNKKNILINGYSQLFSNFDSMTMSDTLLLFKFESDKVEKLSGRVTKLGEEMVKELSVLQKKSSWLKLDDEGETTFSKKVSEVSRQRRVKALLPLVGDDQQAFERGLLLLFSVLASSNMDKIKLLKEIDSDKERVIFLNSANEKLEKLNRDVSQMLNKYYFK
jgi:hypothetical protein